MQEISIPVWAVGIFGAVLLPWLIWLTRQVISNEKDIAVNTNTDRHVANELKKIYEAIDKSNADMRERFTRLDDSITQFMSTEMNLLKQIVNK